LVTTAAEINEELAEAELVCDALSAEVSALQSYIAKHEAGCAAHYEGSLEQAVLEAALVYYRSKASVLRAEIADAEAPVEQPDDEPLPRMN
jgi:hypothetical protein